MNQHLPTYILQLPRRPYFNCAHNMKRLIKCIGLLIVYFSAVLFLLHYSNVRTSDAGFLSSSWISQCWYRLYSSNFVSSNSITRGLIISLYFRSLTSSVLSACHFLCGCIVDVDFIFLFLAFCFFYRLILLLIMLLFDSSSSAIPSPSQRCATRQLI